MNIAFIGCMVMNREMCYEIAHSDNNCRAWWIRQGLHDTPDVLHHELQRYIDIIEEEQLALYTHNKFDYICIGYGLCSDSVIGLKSKTIPLVVPKCEDCISLFLGASDRYYELFYKNPGTYWYNSGWIENGFTPSEESYHRKLEQYIEEYGEDNASYLLEVENEWNEKYNSCIYIKSPIYENPEHFNYAKRASEYLKWKFHVEEGDMSYFHQLLNGPWDEDKFLICPPKHQIIRTYDDQKINVKKSEE